MKPVQYSDFQATGQNEAAPFTLKLHRGEGMTLLAMNWKKGRPSDDFVGFGIQYREPGGDKFYSVQNRLAFPGHEGEVNPNKLSTLLSPIQKFRWIHFPMHGDLPGEFTYRVTPVFMNVKGELSYGIPQEAGIELQRETYPGQMNITFTRGFMSSQAFVDRYGPGKEEIAKLLPAKADFGLDFVPTHPKAEEALTWMGFEARLSILEVLDKAIADITAQVRVVAYDLSEPDVVSRLEKLGDRLKIIVDDSGAHGEADSAETTAAIRLAKTAGETNVKRQHMSSLQHNKTIVVDGKEKIAVCGSTNFSWRGFFVQANNALILNGKEPVKIFIDAFDNYWENNSAKNYGQTGSAEWTDLGLDGIDAKVTFSPHSEDNAQLTGIADDIENTTSNLLFSMAFLYQTAGPVRDVITKIAENNKIFAYGISDKEVGGIELQKPNGTVILVEPQALSGNVPEPFKSEPTGGAGTRLHHKFVVIDFNKPTARVYTGSYNFSKPADRSNGENLLLIRDRRVATAYAIEALRIFDHYHFRVAQSEATVAGDKLTLALPPRKAGELPWWNEDFTNVRKILDRELFA